MSKPKVLTGRSIPLLFIAFGALVSVGGLVAIASAFATDAPSPSVNQAPPSSGPPRTFAATLTFSEEFDADQIDSERWNKTYVDPAAATAPITKRSLWGNRERQVYFDPDYLGLGIDPHQVRDGVLIIEARPLDNLAKSRLAADLDALPAQFADTPLRDVTFSSGMISSRSHFAQRFGYFEMRARWSGGKGVWPAFWLLPASGAWPPEIDVLEAHGDKPGVTFHSLHQKGPPSVTERANVANDDGEFHTYGALWLPDRIDYFVDGQQVASIPTETNLSEPMFMVANLAIGGYWPGDPDDVADFSARLEIDHIRTWELDEISD